MSEPFEDSVLSDGDEDQKPSDFKEVETVWKGKQPTKIACVGCRTIKVKCRLPNGEVPTGKFAADKSKCARCVRLKIPCEYKSAPRRGRKPKDRCVSLQAGKERLKRRGLLIWTFRRSIQAQQQQLQAPALPSTQPQLSEEPVIAPSLPPDEPDMLPIPPPTSGIASDPTAPFFLSPPVPSTSSALPSTSSWPTQGSMLSPNIGFSPQQPPYLSHITSHPSMILRPPTYPPPPAPLSQPGQSSPAQSVPSLSQPSPASVASGGGMLLEHSSLSLAEAAESRAAILRGPSKPSLFAPRARKQAAKQPDPVDLGVLSSLEAAQLIQLFHSHLNPYIILLDKHLHTPEYVRSTSTVLYTAMLAVSAKFFRQDLYQSLLLSAQQLITRCMGGDGQPHLGLCQALLLVVYWKEPFDSSAWLKVGYAIRLAYQLGIHHKRTGPLPADEHQARVMLDSERTWITLVCFDHSYILADDFDTTHETRMITQHDIDIDAWLAETKPYDVPDDNEQGASIELIRVYRLCKNIVNANSKAAAHTLASHLSSMLAETHRKYLDSTSPSYRILVPQAAHKVRFHWRAASVSLGRACLIAAGVNDEMVLADFLSRASELVECFEELAAEGLLRYLQDLTAMTAMGLAHFISQLFPKVNPGVQTTLVRFLTQIYTAATRVKDGNEDSVAGFISRFYRAVLTALRGPLPETRPPSPGQTTLAGHNASVNPFDQLGGMENELFTNLDDLVNELSRDGSYWDSISSAQTNQSWAWLDQQLLAPQDSAPL
ncbi:hypothetical protein JCM8547_009157 [Rhodosporidiobolus lusitaniae]